MTEIVPLKLSMGELYTFIEDGVVQVVFRPAIEALALDADTQIRKVKTRSWACTGLRPVQLPGDTQTRNHRVVDRRTFTMWLATVNENNVPEEKRELLITFQMEAADALDRYFHEGVAENPRAVQPAPTATALTTSEPFTPKTFPLAEVVVLIKQKFGVRISIADLKEKLRQAGAVRQDDRPHAKYERLFWHTGESGKAYEVFGHQIEAVYRLYESTKIRLELRAQRSLPLDPPGWPELPLGGEA